LERRWGAKIHKRGHYRDSARSSRQRSVSSPGVRWIVLAVVVQVRLHAAAVGLAISDGPGHDPGREPATGPAPQNAGHAGTPTGQLDFDAGCQECRASCWVTWRTAF
jgi:hypothetical protein